MLYIISGASRSGKSILAKQILDTYKIPFLPLDSVMMAFMNGVEDSDIHDKLWPDVIAVKLWGFVKAFCESIIYSESDYLIEGEAFLPSLLQELIVKHRSEIKVCFLGYSEISLELKYNNITQFAAPHDWLIQQSEDDIKQHIENMISYSKKIKDLCYEYKIQYFDTSTDFRKSLANALAYMMDSQSSKVSNNSAKK